MSSTGVSKMASKWQLPISERVEYASSVADMYWNNGVVMVGVPQRTAMVQFSTSPGAIIYPTAPPAADVDYAVTAPLSSRGMSQYPKADAPPPYGMNPPMQPAGPPIAVVVGGPPLGPEPASITCPSCHAQIQTRVTHQSSTKTHIIALLLCLFGCWPCVCLPYCMDSCQTANHNCPRCGSFLGSFQN